MPDTNTIQGNLIILGSLQAGSFTFPAGAITDAAISGTASISGSKVRGTRQATYAEASATTSTTKDHPIYQCTGATGTILEVSASLAVANIGDSTVAVDILKNGASLLSSPITLTSATAQYVALPGTPSSTSVIDGDFFEVSVTATIGTGTLGKGLVVNFKVNEDAA